MRYFALLLLACCGLVAQPIPQTRTTQYTRSLLLAADANAARDLLGLTSLTNLSAQYSSDQFAVVSNNIYLKSGLRVTNVTLLDQTADRVLQLSASGVLESSGISSAQLATLSGIDTSLTIQQAFSTKLANTNGAAYGLQLPDLTLGALAYRNASDGTIDGSAISNSTLESALASYNTGAGSIEQRLVSGATAGGVYVGSYALLAASQYATNTATVRVVVSNSPPVLGDLFAGEYVNTRPATIVTNADFSLIRSLVDTNVVWQRADSLDEAPVLQRSLLLDTSYSSLSAGDVETYDGTNWVNYRGIYNAVAFGADGYDTDGDSTAIQAAIDAAYAAGGGSVYFPYATNYLLNATLDLKPGVILRGDAPAGASRIYETDDEVLIQSTAKLRAIDGLNSPMITNNPALGYARFPNTSTPDGEFHDKTAHKGGIVNLILDGNKGALRRGNNDNRTDGVFFRNAAWFIFDGVGFHNMAGRAMHMRSANFGLMRECVGQIWDQGGVLLDDCADWTISDNSMGGGLSPTLWLNSQGTWKNTIVGGQYWNTRDESFTATLDTGTDQELFTVSGGHPYWTGELLTFRDGTLTVTDLNSTTSTLDLNSLPDIATAGSGYAAGDIVNLVGGTAESANFVARFRVATVGGSGDVTALTTWIGGDYTATVGTAATTASTTAQTGVGTGLVVSNLTWNVVGLEPWRPAYVVHTSTTDFKIARGYAQALEGIALNFTNLPSGNLEIRNGPPSNIVLTDGAEMNSFTGLRTDQASEHGIALYRSSRNTFDSIVSMENGWDNAAFGAAGIAFLEGASRNQAHGFSVKTQEYGVLIDAFTDRQQVGGFTGEADTMYSINISDSATVGNSLNLIDGEDQYLWVFPHEMIPYNGNAALSEISGVYPVMLFPDDGSLPGVHFTVHFPNKWKSVQMLLYWVNMSAGSSGDVTWGRFYAGLDDGVLVTASDTSDSITVTENGTQYEIERHGFGSNIALDSTKPILRMRLRRVDTTDTSTNGAGLVAVCFRVRDTHN